MVGLNEVIAAVAKSDPALASQSARQAGMNLRTFIELWSMEHPF
jgi:hypothetical protein